jgi:DNA polymerase V
MKVSFFPTNSPAEETIDRPLDLHELLISHPAATFFVRVEGNWDEARLKDRDILIVDRALTPKTGSLVLAVVNGQFTINRLSRLKSETDCQIWGVVTYVIHKTRPLE